MENVQLLLKLILTVKMEVMTGFDYLELALIW